MPIYTKTGDRGKTSLFSGKRVLKSDLRVETYGTIDELNSIIGVVVVHVGGKKDLKKLKVSILEIQNTLFYIGSYLADLPDVINDIDLEGKTLEFEGQIDEMTEQMPKLTSFIIPGGGEIGAHLHQARTITRRAERVIIKLSQKEKVDARVIKYVNRLSDLFFTMSRYANYIEKKKETIWER